MKTILILETTKILEKLKKMIQMLMIKTMVVDVDLTILMKIKILEITRVEMIKIKIIQLILMVMPMNGDVFNTELNSVKFVLLDMF